VWYQIFGKEPDCLGDGIFVESDALVSETEAWNFSSRSELQHVAGGYVIAGRNNLCGDESWVGFGMLRMHSHK
jgi:hypothetical protein